MTASIIGTRHSDRQTTKTGLVWTHYQAQLTVQDCAPGNPMSGYPSEETLDGKHERIDVPFNK
ncbi:hypothetical protein DPMN_094945 [Dreissena polymorpha]|uniref:Uncharacterized protein n=1 Tax=Dreissena polymorpha TaxID=45954 RepID=A0A9D4R298_DREPO|nr:hypothetical protein DPMN_094945 [Dreissena polymorpha]